MQGISQLAEDLLASQEGLGSMELVSFSPQQASYGYHSCGLNDIDHLNVNIQ